MLSTLRPAIAMTALFTLLTGVAYPLAITGVVHALFPSQAEGGLIRDASGQVIGARLIGQGFAKPQYLHPRPSAAGTGYDAFNSAGSNMGPLNPKLAERMATDAAAIRKDAPGASIPADAVTTSGSGLDPDISPAYADLQVNRVAKARGVSPEQVRMALADNTDGRDLGFMGEPRVNVLELNLELDQKFPAKS
jgi:K+-transporting ATPase ATPase C chain